MNEEIFDTISDLLSKSGAAVSKKADSTIVVSLPNSEGTLAECTDNGDGTLSYTIYRGNGSSEAGNGTPEEFKARVVEAMDSWIDYVPYEQYKDGAAPTPEFRHALGESREDKMRNTLFDMGLDTIQVEAIMDVAGVLLESNGVSAYICGKELYGTNIENLVSRKENKNFIKRQWAIDQYKSRNIPWPGQVTTNDALASIGLSEPTNEQLVEFAKSHMGGVEKQHIAGDDEQYSGAVYSKYDTTEKGSGKKGGSKKKSDDTAADVMSNEGTFEIEENNNLDEDVSAQEVRHSDNEEDQHFSSAKDASEQLGVGIEEAPEEEPKQNNAAIGSRLIKMINDLGYTNPELQNMDWSQLEQCYFAVSKLVNSGKFNAEECNQTDLAGLLRKLGYKKGEVPSNESIVEEIMPTVWVGDVSSLGGSELSDVSEDEIPDAYIETIEDGANELKASLNDGYAIYSSDPLNPGATILDLLRVLGKGTPTFVLIKTLFGIPGKTTGVVQDILSGNPEIMKKLEQGEPLLENPALTAAQCDALNKATKNAVGANAIRLIQDSFGIYMDNIIRGLPAGYAQVNDETVSLAEVPPNFVNMIRSIMLGKGCPLAGYSWKAIDRLINNLGSVMMFKGGTTSPANPAARKLTGKIARKPVNA
jgi:hypothetical protein